MIRVLHGDCRDVLPTLAAASVHCVVTSPPYYGLRDYGVAGQIGLEATPDEYLQTMVAVFREVRRVLRDDGTLWLNMGDSYASKPAGSNGLNDGRANREERLSAGVPFGAKPKDLLMMPARLALALQQDGWWIRSDIIWSKPNPMPESVTDRPVSSYEHVFLLAKSARYFYDALAIAEPAAANETLQLLPDREAGRRVRQSETGQGRPDEGMPILRYITDAQVAGNTRGTREVACGHAEAQRSASASGQAEGIQSFGAAFGCISGVAEERGRPSLSGAVSRVAEAQGCAEAILRERQGTSGDRPLPGNGEGQGEFSAWRSQAPWFDGDTKHTDGVRVGGNQGERQPQVPLLQEADETPDDGSRHTLEQGRTPRSLQRRSGMQELQQPQGKQNRAPTLRSARNVWTIATAPFPEAHFATFPPALAERCIKAGTSERGCCTACGAPWVRQTGITEEYAAVRAEYARIIADRDTKDGRLASGAISRPSVPDNRTFTTGWLPSCRCDAPTRPCTVLDPFAGAGTTLLVADRLQRSAIGIELNEAYAAMSRDRIYADAPLLAEVAD